LMFKGEIASALAQKGNINAIATLMIQRYFGMTAPISVGGINRLRICRTTSDCVRANSGASHSIYGKRNVKATRRLREPLIAGSVDRDDTRQT